MIIGEGSYGQVSIRNGRAVKKFNRLPHLIQEYIALRYLNTCKYIVRPLGLNLDELELYMELYDGSLREWMRKKRTASTDEISHILKSILYGLIELHDRNLVHGDLKPSNILIRNQPFIVVLGYCGFVSVAKYAKVNRTAAAYREPIIKGDYAHDMYSFGVCLLELIKHFHLNNEKYRTLAFDLIKSERRLRPNAREVLNNIFHTEPVQWIAPKYDTHSLNISTTDRKHVKTVMKELIYKYNINRGKIGYISLLRYLDSQHVSSTKYVLHICLTIFILSSVFGPPGFTEANVSRICKINSTYKINEYLMSMITNDDFINVLFFK